MSKGLRPFNPYLDRALRHNHSAQVIDGRYAMYERRKAEWKNQNPGATPAQYDGAIRRIVKELGI